MADQITHKELSKYVRVYWNGSRVGSIRYSPQRVGWFWWPAVPHSRLYPDYLNEDVGAHSTFRDVLNALQKKADKRCSRTSV